MLERASGWLRARPFPVDVTVAGLLVLLCLVGSTGPGTTGPVGLVLTLALLVPLAWRRRAPVPAAVVVVVAGLAEVVLVSEFLLANLAAPVMVYALAAYAPRRWGRIGLVLGLVGALLAGGRYFGGISISSGTESIQGTVFSAAAIGVLVLATWALGDLKRVRLQREQALRERADLVELERDQEVRLAAGAERARIAREMHDVVAHGLSVMVLQAEGARYSLPPSATVSRAALEEVARTGRTAIGEMRQLLGLLRSDPAGDALRPTPPAPGLDDLDELVAQARSTGAVVTVRRRGDLTGVPPVVALTAYRVVQEGLTNARRHGGDQVEVDLVADDDELLVRVHDQGRTDGGVPAEPPGLGLVGLHERVAAAGGRASAAPDPTGGFTVEVALPLRVASARTGTP